MEEVAQPQNQAANNSPKKDYRFLNYFALFWLIFFILFLVSSFIGSSCNTGLGFTQSMQCRAGESISNVSTFILMQGGVIFFIVFGIVALFNAFRNRAKTIAVKNKAITTTLYSLAGISILLSFTWLVLPIIVVFYLMEYAEMFMSTILSPIFFIIALILFLIARYLEKKNK